MNHNHTNTHILRLLSLAGRARCNAEHLKQLIIHTTYLNDWQSLAIAAEQQGMTPLFYAHCRAAGVAIPVDVRRQLQVLTARHQLTNQTFAHALGKILSACSKAGLEVLVLKEVALAWTVYADPALRPIHRLELLMPPAGGNVPGRILSTLGYRRSEVPAGALAETGHHRDFWKMNDGLRITVRVHHTLFDPIWSECEADSATLLQRGKAIMLADVPARCLSPEDMLWRTYQHMITDRMRVIHFSDFIHVAEHFAAEIDWDRMRRTHMGIPAALALLHGVSPLADNIIHAARLPVSVQRTAIDEAFFLALRTVEPALNMAAPSKQSPLPGQARAPAGNSADQWHDQLCKETGLAHVFCNFSAVMDVLTNRRPAFCQVSKPANPPDPRADLQHEGSNEGIPRVIHQTWKDTLVPEDLTAYRRTWQHHHPGWSFILWTDIANRELIRQHYAWFLPIYDGYPEPIMRADAARYFILHYFGGVYADLDFEAFRPITPLLAERQVVLGLEPAEHLLLPLAVERDLDQIVCNAFMASIPAHPFWNHVFRQLVEFHQSAGPLDATGPFLLTGACTSYLDNEQITLVPARLLYPISNTRIFREMEPAEQRQSRDEAYAIHHWRGSWWKKDTQPATTVIGDLREHGQSLDRFGLPVDQYLATLRGRSELPLVSAMMVTRNRPGLAERSLRCFLNQTYPAKELIILDDGEDDRLETLVQGLADPRVRFFRINPGGRTLGELRNMTLARAQGEFVGQWDDDDLSDPQRLEIQMAAILIHGVEACLLQRHMIWFPQMRRLAISNIRQWESSFICRKTKVPPYPTLRQGEDTPVINQIAMGRYLWMDHPWLYVYTFHGENTFGTGHFEELWRAASESFEGDAYRRQLTELGRRLGMNMVIEKNSAPSRGYNQENMTVVRSDISAGITVTPVVIELAPTQQSAEQTRIPKVLILIPVKDAVRHLPRCLENLRTLTFSHTRISLGFLESDSQDGTYPWLKEILPELAQEFRRAELFRRDYGYRMEGSRWAIGAQRRRREILARSRNYLLSRALQDEDWVLWLDVDVAGYPADVLEMLLAGGKEIVVPNCVVSGTNQQYDLNTYRLKSVAGDIDWQQYIIDGLLQPPGGMGRWYLNDLDLFDEVEVDAVGGTMLLIRADLHREGLIFPTFPYRLTIETEGLAAMAKDMGYRCWGLPQVVIHHPVH